MTLKNTSEVIAEAIKRIVDVLNPDKIYLFGSHVWGVPTTDSDIDLFIIVRDSDQPSYKRSRDVYRSLRGMKEPIEVLVRTTDEVNKKKSVVSSLTRKVIEQGRLMYG